MLDPLSIVVLGFLLGMRHATDPDHVVAVTTIVSRERSIRAAALIGALWGVGHTLTILVVGGAIMLFGAVITPRVGLTMEFSVAVMLILLGILNLSGVLGWIDGRLAPGRTGTVPFDTHAHGDYVHQHAHDEDGGAHGHTEEDTPLGRLDRTFRRFGLYHTVRPLVVGTVHGLAGSAAIALLVLATIPRSTWALAYLLVFGVGTIAGMMLITVAGSLPFTYTARRFRLVNHCLGLASGLVSVGFGVFLVYRIGLVDGLFTSAPRWTPG